VHSIKPRHIAEKFFLFRMQRFDY